MLLSLGRNAESNHIVCTEEMIQIIGDACTSQMHTDATPMQSNPKGGDINGDHEGTRRHQALVLSQLGAATNPSTPT